MNTTIELTPEEKSIVEDACHLLYHNSTIQLKSKDLGDIERINWEKAKKYSVQVLNKLQ